MAEGGVDGDEVAVAVLLIGIIVLSRRLQKSRWKVRAESTSNCDGCQCQGQRKRWSPSAHPNA